MSRATLVAAAAVVLFVFAAAGYWVHAAWAKRAEQQRIGELLRDTTEVLRRGLVPGVSASLVERIDANLGAAKAPHDPRLADAAGLYMLSAREIVRRRVQLERLERQAAHSGAALAAHMRSGGRRNDAWFRSALELKQHVERDHREVDIALKTLDELLFGLAETERGLAPHVAPGVLLDEDARRKALGQLELESKQAAAALEKTRALAVR